MNGSIWTSSLTDVTLVLMEHEQRDLRSRGVRGGIVKWALPSWAREALTCYVSETRAIACSPERQRLSAAIVAAMSLASGGRLGSDHREAIILYADGADHPCGSQEVLGRALVALLVGVGQVVRCDPSSQRSSSVAHLVAPFEASVDERRAVVDPLVDDRESCAQLAHLRDPMLRLAALVSVRAEILGRVGTAREFPGDGARVDALDHRLDVMFSGPEAGLFQEAVRVMEAVSEVARSWPGARRRDEIDLADAPVDVL